MVLVSILHTRPVTIAWMVVSKGVGRIALEQGAYNVGIVNDWLASGLGKGNVQTIIPAQDPPEGK